MNTKSIEETYRKISMKDHVILRKGMYVGSDVTEETLLYTADLNNLEELKIIKKVVKYNPAFYKLFDEIVSNASDEANRENSSTVSYIKTWIDKETNTIVVENDCNGGGIPVEIHPVEKIYTPELIFSHFHTSSNYDDSDERFYSGLNGQGSKLVFCLSTYGKVECADGKKSFEQEYINNLSEITEPIIKKSNKFYVRVTYKPDFKQFKGIESITDDMISLFVKRIIDLAVYNPKVKFYYNDTLIKIKSVKDWMRLHVEESTELIIDDTNPKWVIGICKSPSEQFESVSIVSSVSTFKGGTHVNYISMNLSKTVAESFSKKIKASWVDVRSKLLLFVICKIPNPTFDSQSKETLSNQITKELLNGFVFQEFFIKKIMKSEIVQSILDAIEIKEKLELSRLQKSVSRLKVEKLIDANSKKREECTLFIFEGESSGNSCRKFRDPMLHGIFKLRGKIMNISEIEPKKILENKELVNLMNTIGLVLGKPVQKQELRYSKIIIYCDKDFDGDGITALLINFFNLWPELFEWGIVYRGLPPLMVVSKETEKYVFYTDDEYIEWRNNKKDISTYRTSFKKGVGSINNDDYRNLIINPYLIRLEKDISTDTKLNIWFGPDTSLRKIELLD